MEYNFHGKMVFKASHFERIKVAKFKPEFFDFSIILLKNTPCGNLATKMDLKMRQKIVAKLPVSSPPDDQT